jgi:mannosyltransferase
MSKRTITIFMIVAAVLRLAFLWVAPFWYDEDFTLLLARAPFAQMWAAILGDVHPPLYYLLIWPLGQLLNVTGWPVWVLRIPSALFSIASVWIFWQIVEPYPRVRLAALVLMVIMPVGLYYAQEARMYALLELLVLAAYLAMLNRSWGKFMVLCVLILYTQNYGLYYVPALFLVAIIRYREDWWEILMAGVATVGFYLIWVPSLLQQMHNIQGVYWMHASEGTPLVMIFRLLFMPDNNSVLQIPLMLAGFGWIFAALLYTIFNKRPQNTRYLSGLFIMASLPMLLAGISSLIWQPVLYYRPLIGSAPFLFIILARPVEAFFQPEFQRRKALYAAAFIIPLLLVVDGMMYLYAAHNKSFNQIQQDLDYIRAHWEPGDVILSNGDDPWVSLAPYAPDLPHYRIPICSEGIGGLSDATRKALGIQYEPEKLQYKRAWVVWEFTPLSRAPRECVAERYQLDINHPIFGMISNEYVDAGVWLIER